MLRNIGPTECAVKKAFEEGKIERRMGKALASNPYRPLSPDCAHAWEQGWRREDRAMRLGAERPWEGLYEQLSAIEALYVTDHARPRLNDRGERLLRYLQARRRRAS